MPEGIDPTFYRSPAAAIAAPPEQLAYVAAFDPDGRERDSITVVDCDADSASYGQVVGWAELPTTGNELHHFGWNACSSALCHQALCQPHRSRPSHRICVGLERQTQESQILVLHRVDDPRDLFNDAVGHRVIHLPRRAQHLQRAAGAARGPRAVGHAAAQLGLPPARRAPGRAAAPGRYGRGRRGLVAVRDQRHQ